MQSGRSIGAKNPCERRRPDRKILILDRFNARRPTSTFFQFQVRLLRRGEAVLACQEDGHRGTNREGDSNAVTFDMGPGFDFARTFVIVMLVCGHF